MIGVLCENSEMRIVREFFQLFKTPWSFYEIGKSFEVVVVTQDIAVLPCAKLLIVYSSRRMMLDNMFGTETFVRLSNVHLSYKDKHLPLYGDSLTFTPSAGKPLCIKAGTETAGFQMDLKGTHLVRIGYDLFREVGLLLTVGQPPENASIATLDVHIDLLRELIISNELPVIEIPPAPNGYKFVACLTHDVDFVGIRKHFFDHTMLGFVYRAGIMSLIDWIVGRMSIAHVCRNWRALASLPLVYLGWAEDFWLEFRRYLNIEKHLPSTFFLIPFKNRKGERLSGRLTRLRAAKYDVADIKDWVGRIIEAGCEIGVHGIDAWHDPEKGRHELERVCRIAGTTEAGVRMHWLCFQGNSPQTLEEAGFAYDSTLGYNGTAGYRNGTSQVFGPLDTHRLLELPMIVQDVALLSRRNMGLSQGKGFDICKQIIQSFSASGGVFTIDWHIRSLSPERLWGQLYVKILHELKSCQPWFATAGQAVEWFRMRRSISFESVTFSDNRLLVRLKSQQKPNQVGTAVRITLPERSSAEAIAKQIVNIPWDGVSEIDCALIAGRT